MYFREQSTDIHAPEIKVGKAHLLLVLCINGMLCTDFNTLQHDKRVVVSIFSRARPFTSQNAH